MKRKILTALLAVVLMFTIVVPVIASPFFADNNGGANGAPEGDGTSSVLPDITDEGDEGEPVPYGDPVTPGTVLYYEDIGGAVDFAWSAGATPQIVQTGAPAPTPPQFSVTFNPDLGGYNSYYKNAQLRFYLSSSLAGTLNLNSDGYSIGKLILGNKEFTGTLVDADTAAPYILYDFGDKLDAGVTGFATINAMFFNNATPAGTVLTIKAELWYPQSDGTLAKVENVGGDVVLTAASTYSWGLSSAGGAFVVPEVDASEVTHNFSFTAKATNANNTHTSGKHGVDKIDFTGYLELPVNVTIPADATFDLYMADGNKVSSTVGVSGYSLEINAQRNKIMYAFTYDIANGDPKTFDAANVEFRLRFSKLAFGDMKTEKFVLDFYTDAKVYLVNSTETSALSQTKASYTVTRKFTSEGFDNDVYTSLKFNKYLIVPAGVVAGDLTGFETLTAGDVFEGGIYPNQFVEGQEVTYTVANLEFSKKGTDIEVKDFMIVDKDFHKLLVPKSITLGSYASNATELRIAVGNATYIYTVTNADYTKGSIDFDAAFLSAAKNGTKSLADDSKTTAHFTGMGLYFGDVDSDFAKSTAAGSGVRFSFVFNPDFLPIQEGDALTAANTAVVSFKYEKEGFAAESYSKENTSNQVQLIHNAYGTKKSSKVLLSVVNADGTASTKEKVTYGSVLTYQLTISNESAVATGRVVLLSKLIDILTHGGAVANGIYDVTITAPTTNMDDFKNTSTKNYTTFNAAYGTSGKDYYTDWVFEKSATEQYTQLAAGQSIIIEYKYKVKTYEQMVADGLVKEGSTVAYSFNINNKFYVDKINTGGGGPIIPVKPPRSVPFISYGADATFANTNPLAAADIFDPLGTSKIVNYTVNVQNTINKIDGSSNLTKLQLTLKLPNNFDFSAGINENTIKLVRSNRALGINSTDVQASNGGKTVVVKYYTSSDKTGTPLYTITYTRTDAANGAIQWVAVIVMEDATNGVLNARKVSEAAQSADKDEKLTVTFSAKTPTDYKGFVSSTSAEAFNMTSSLQIWDGGAELNAKDKPLYRYSDTIASSNVNKDVNVKYSGNQLNAIARIIGQNTGNKNVSIVTSIARASGVAYPNANVMFIGYPAEIKATIKNRATSAFNPLNNQFAIHVPKGVEIDAAAAVNVLISGSTSGVTGVTATVSGWEADDTTGGRIYIVTFDRKIELTASYTVEISRTTGLPYLAWTDATAVVTLRVNIKEDFTALETDKLGTGTVSSALLFDDGTEAESTYTPAGNRLVKVSDPMFVNSKWVGADKTTKLSKYAVNHSANFDAHRLRFAPYVNITGQGYHTEGGTTKLSENLTNGDIIKWTVNVNHNAIHKIALAAGANVYVFLPEHLTLENSPTFAGKTPTVTLLDPANPAGAKLLVWENVNALSFTEANKDKTIEIETKVVIPNLEDLQYYGERSASVYFVPADADQPLLVNELGTDPRPVGTGTFFTDSAAEEISTYVTGSKKGAKDATSVYVWGQLKASLYAAVTGDAGYVDSITPNASGISRIDGELGEEFLYTLSVQNGTMATPGTPAANKYLDLVLINRLPAFGDHGALTGGLTARGSEFAPDLIISGGVPKINVYSLALDSVGKPPKMLLYGTDYKIYYTSAAPDTATAKDTDWVAGNPGGLGWTEQSVMTSYAGVTAFRLEMNELNSQTKILVDVHMQIPQSIDFADAMAQATRRAVNLFTAKASFDFSMKVVDSAGVELLNRLYVSSGTVGIKAKDPLNNTLKVSKIVQNAAGADISKLISAANKFSVVVENTSTNKQYPITLAKTGAGEYEIVEIKNLPIGEYKVTETGTTAYPGVSLADIYSVFIKAGAAAEVSGDNTTFKLTKMATSGTITDIGIKNRQKPVSLTVNAVYTDNVGIPTPIPTGAGMKYDLVYLDQNGKEVVENGVIKNGSVKFTNMIYGDKQNFTLRLEAPFAWKPTDTSITKDTNQTGVASGRVRYVYNFKKSFPLNTGTTLIYDKVMTIDHTPIVGAFGVLKSWDGAVKNPGVYTQFILAPAGEDYTSQSAVTLKYDTKYGVTYQAGKIPIGDYNLYEITSKSHTPHYMHGAKDFVYVAEIDVNGETCRVYKLPQVIKIEEGVAGNSMPKLSIYNVTPPPTPEPSTSSSSSTGGGGGGDGTPAPDPSSSSSSNIGGGSTSSSSSSESTASDSGDGVVVDIPEIQAPGAGIGTSWSLISFLASIVGAASALFLFFNLFSRKNKEDEENEEEKSNGRVAAKVVQILAIIAGLAVGVVFLIVDDLRAPMTIINTWTPLVLAVFALHVVVALVFFALVRRKQKVDEYDENYE